MTRKLFVLEDEVIAQYIMKTVLKQFKSIAADYFDNSIALIAHLTSHLHEPEQLPDVIFIDIHLPGWDGWTVLDAINHLAPMLEQDIPVFIVSTSISPVDRKRALAYPFVRDFFSKPVTTAQIREVEKRLNSFDYLLN